MWLARALNGTCGATSPFDAGDCSSDDKGLFTLPPAAYASWQAWLASDLELGLGLGLGSGLASK